MKSKPSYKTQPKPLPQQPPPDQREPTLRYCKLANELRARAPGQWAKRD